MQYDIFISYKRRGTSSATAAYLYDLLTKKGYSVFFDRKEMRLGHFDSQLYEHIENAKDVIILLEESSLASCFNDVKDSYKNDWFCMEIMHILRKKKPERIIPLLLEGYSMPEEKSLPDEIKQLPRLQALPLDITEIDKFYKEYVIDKNILESKPRNLYLSQLEGDGLADFLFFSDGDCDIYEFGHLVGTLDQNVDEEHPYRLPVKRCGEHRFKCINNDTCEEKTISVSIDKDSQKFVNVPWTLTQNLWDLNENMIQAEDNSDVLFFWGKGLYNGTTKHNPDIIRSFACLKRAADMKNYASINFIKEHDHGLISEKGAKRSDALQWYMCSSNYGSSYSMSVLGYMYLEGLDVEKDYSKSIEWFLKAAEQKDGQSMGLLGVMYEKGLGVEQDYIKAAEWYTKAAEQENELSMSHLGYLFEKGRGVEQDYTKAMEWYIKAAKRNDISAIRRMSILYRKGLGVDQNLDKAEECLKRAIELGHKKSNYDLAWMYYEQGRYDEALPYAEKAVKLMPDDPNVQDALASVNQGIHRYNNSIRLNNYTLTTTTDSYQETESKVKKLMKLILGR